jgi:DNA polymerase-1
MEQRPSFYILDAYSLIFQSFHAIPEMASPEGKPVNAIYGVFRKLMNILNQHNPDYFAAAYDGGGVTLQRREVYPEYKAHRSPMPDDLKSQMPEIKRIFEAMNIPTFVAPGMEADDVIATLARRGESYGLDVTICTSDKDARQLLTPHVRILNLRKNAIVDAKAVELEWGIRPDQVVDYLALTGDAADNVPGMKSVGPKTATLYLQQFGTLENLIANADQIPSEKKRKAVVDGAETARLAKRLVQLNHDVPIRIDWNAIVVSSFDEAKLEAICMDNGFVWMLDEIYGRVVN